MARTKKEARSARKAADSTKVSAADAAKRERSLRACTRCRQRKQRCDNALPHCSNCIKGNVPCEAFPINVVSRETLLQLYDQLQESTRRNSLLQEELDLVRLVSADPLSQFSALVVQQVSDNDSCGQGDRTAVGAKTNGGPPSAQSERQSKSNTSTLPTKEQGKRASPLAGSSDKKRTSQHGLDLFVDLLQNCFPAVAPAVSLAAGSGHSARTLDRQNNLVDIASFPIQELCSLLGRGPHLHGQATADGWLRRMGESVKETASKLFAATDMTRVSAVMLWALLAMIKHRVEELLRLNKVLTNFMQVWQTRAMSEASPLFCDVMTTFYRAYSWLHLQTAIMAGKLQAQVTSVISLDTIDPARCKKDARSFAAAFQVEQKRLEYHMVHLFAMPAGSFTDIQHAEAVWTLLTVLKQLSDCFEQSTAHMEMNPDIVMPVQDGLLRYKLAVQLYGMFPRLLHRHCTDRRVWRWLANAGPLAATALSFFQLALTQFRWLGDHELDGAQLTELLAAFAWIHQQQGLHPAARPEWVKTIEAAVEVGEGSMTRWPEYSAAIATALGELRALRDEPMCGAPMWTTVTPYMSSPAPTSSIRTPTGSEGPMHSAGPMAGWREWATDDGLGSCVGAEPALLATQMPANHSPWCDAHVPTTLTPPSGSTNKAEPRKTPVLLYVDEDTPHAA